MSLLTELGAQLRATSDELPTGLITAALDRLRSATEQLTWVRQASVDPIGVPLLGNATEHAERAAAALRVAQDAIAAYLGVLGLSAEAQRPPNPDPRAGPAEPTTEPRPRPGTGAPPPPLEGPPRAPEKLGPWWQQRVSELTGEPPSPPEEVAARHPSTAELLRKVAADVRSGDRARLGRHLQNVGAATGLGLSVATPPVLRRLAGDLLGHQPRPEDVPRLRTAVSARVRSLLPGTSPGVLEALLARICRAPAQADPPEHSAPSEGPGAGGSAADNAVTASVLTGVLLARLGRDPDTLDPDAPEPLRRDADA
jgi:hypothetical protein